MRGRRVHVDDSVRRANNGGGRGSLIGRSGGCGSGGGGCEEEDKDDRDGVSRGAVSAGMEELRVYRKRRCMEAKSVTSGMTSVSRRSREHRSTKNVGTIQDASASQLDIASTSKNPKVCILDSSDASEYCKDFADGSKLRRSSRLSHASQKQNAASVPKGLEARANGAKVHLQGAQSISPAPSSARSFATTGGASEAVTPCANGEAGQGVIGVVELPHLENSNDASAVPGSGGAVDAAGQSMARSVRGRPRGRHATPAKKNAKRAKRLQEVSLTDTDGERILGRRIKVFWPDEDRWFYGLVKAYSRGRKSHKIVYDDKEEEWLKLHEEKFKLQVLDGEVFGTQQLPSSTEVAVIGSTIDGVNGKGSNARKQEHLNGEIGAHLGAGWIQAPAGTSVVCVPSGHVRESVNGVAPPQVCSDGDHREQSSSRGEVSLHLRAVVGFEDATAMVCEGEDFEDPYAIEHTSISDSLVAFMRSKQSRAESGRVPAANVVLPGAVAANSSEVSPSAESLLCNQVKGNVEISNVALASSDARDVFSEPPPSEGCAFEGRGAAEGISCEGEKSCIDSELLVRAEGGGVDSTTVFGKHTAVDIYGTSDCAGSHTTAEGEGERGVVEDVELSNADSSPLEGEVCFRGEEKGARIESREDDALKALDDAAELGDRVVECSVGREVGAYLGKLYFAGCCSREGLQSEMKLVSKSSGGGSSRDNEQPRPTWLVRTERFMSQFIATNLVHISCTIPGHHLSSWGPDVDNVWRCVPYLTLFVDVVLGSERLKENPLAAPATRCYQKHSAKGFSSQRSLQSGLGPWTRRISALSRPSPSLGTTKLVLQGIRTSLDGCNSQLLLLQDDDSEVMEGFAEANPPHSESPCTSSDNLQPPFFVQSGEPVSVELSCEPIPVEEGCQPMLVERPCEAAIAEQLCEREVLLHPCDPMVVDQPCEPVPVEQAHSVSVRHVPEVLDTGGEEALQGVGTITNDASSPRYGEADASDSYPTAPRGHYVEVDVVGDTNAVVEAGSAEGLTEVQIGSAVEGEDEGGLACYRSWKSVKRGYSQILPEDLGSNGLGTGCRFQGLLDSELGYLALTKRQKVHVESLSSIVFENGIEDGEKEPLLVEYEVHEEGKTRSTDTRECDSALPRVNVLKLRKCSTGRGGWRVAGNSCMADRSVGQCGDGGEPLTPSSVAGRKRCFSEHFESNEAERPEENGHLVSFVEGACVSGHEMRKDDGTDGVKVKVKGMWSNCEVSSMNEASLNPRKRFKNGSTSSGSSDDSYAPQSRAEETYPRRNTKEHVYAGSVCEGCMANVLVVQHDRGWREHGASIELQSCDGRGWMLIISVRGENMYAYKAEQTIGAGTTNRHSHAVVWRGGKGWSLEFEDKKHWQAFKELHEECYRRNAKASSVRQIPIPGVRHIEDMAPRSPGCQFTRPYSRYICRVEDEVETALGKNRVVYDMDSEDEQWLAQVNTERANARGTRTRPLIAEETLERLIDKLEKDAYLHQQQQKGTELDPNDVIAESCTGLATQEVINVIYGYWLNKRTRKGMALVRHFQPPAWEQYQRQVRLWEKETAGAQLHPPHGSTQQSTEDMKKPPLFAFCLRPRGLEAKHKLSKQKSHRKQMLTGTAPRPWFGYGSLNGSSDSTGKRQYYTETANGVLPGPRRPGRPRLTEDVGASLRGSFNARMRESAVPAGAMSSMGYRNQTLHEYAQRRAGKSKKGGRKAHRQRLLAAAQESRRKRLLRNMGSAELQQQPDLASAAARARSVAEAARARAQALYAVADAAMHKAVAAVIAADALRATEQLEKPEEEEVAAVVGGDSATRPTYGSWRRGVSGSALGSLGTKGSATRHGLESDGEDALLPVASWSQELGAGLGTRLLNKDARMEGLMSSRSVQLESPPPNVGLGRTRGESMVAMLTR